MLDEIIKNFKEQLDYEPVIENAETSKKASKFIVCGMGGSNLAAGIIKSWKPKLNIIIHRDYGLPEMGDAQLKEFLIIISSYSGNTEEALSSFNEAYAKGLAIFVIGTGGQLLELARARNIPFIKFPDINSGPRFAIGYSIKATLKAMNEGQVLNEIGGGILAKADHELIGKKLAEGLKNKIPLIYSSGRNAGLARYWKISFNETAKLPAFYNFLPELNHNEMAGFDSKIFDGKLNHEFAFIFFNDPEDDPRIQKRMIATKKVLENRGFEVINFDLSGQSSWHKSFASILTAIWTSYHLAQAFGIDPEDVSMIEDFKKSLSNST